MVWFGQFLGVGGGGVFQADRNGHFRNHAPRLVDQDGACI